MIEQRQKLFVKTLLPFLKKWAKSWFKPGTKSPEGYRYGCNLCDAPDFGTKDRHEESCLYQRSKDVLEGIEKSKKERFKDRINGLGKRITDKQVRSLIEYDTYNLILKHMYEKGMLEVIPLDYKDKNNRSVVCSCWLGFNKMKHTKDCPHVVLGTSLVKLIQIRK